ncbi:MAG TPA: hypothetical protein VGG72_08020 [Bryobacteraceae bacterium]|jgi:hypothetical protein
MGEALPEGFFLRPRMSFPASWPRGRTAATALDIARDVARKLIEARRERDAPNADHRNRRVGGPPCANLIVRVKEQHKTRIISSKMTIFYKIILPAMWISFFGVATFGLFSSAFGGPGGTPPLPEDKWEVLGLGLIGAAVWRYFIPLKRVSMNGGDLIVSNYVREVRVPFRRIRRVSESRFEHPRSIKIFFDEDTGFGAMILFLPVFMFRPWREHPTTKRLRELSGSD